MCSKKSFPHLSAGVQVLSLSVCTRVSFLSSCDFVTFFLRWWCMQKPWFLSHTGNFKRVLLVSIEPWRQRDTTSLFALVAAAVLCCAALRWLLPVVQCNGIIAAATEWNCTRAVIYRTMPWHVAHFSLSPSQVAARVLHSAFFLQKICNIGVHACVLSSSSSLFRLLLSFPTHLMGTFLIQLQLNRLLTNWGTKV